MPYHFIAKLLKCRDVLVRWKSRGLSNTKIQIEELMKELQLCNEGVLMVEKSRKAKEIMNHILDLWAKEENF